MPAKVNERIEVLEEAVRTLCTLIRALDPSGWAAKPLDHVMKSLEGDKEESHGS